MSIAHRWISWVDTYDVVNTILAAPLEPFCYVVVIECAASHTTLTVDTHLH